jgi:hypothetical protein
MKDNIPFWLKESTQENLHYRSSADDFDVGQP